MSSITDRAVAPILLGSEARDWLQLLKPRVMTLVVFTGAVGMWLAPGHMHPVLALTAVLCIAVAAGAAGAINMWYDRDIDRLMNRTANRPIPAGRVLAGDALGFGIALSVSSVVVMSLATNLLAGALLASSILFYVFVYTIWLKRRTPQNIVIGGAAGAFPPMIGWAAATGQMSLLPVLLFALVFMWTPPHFWALSLYACKDYTRAGVPMLPVVAGPRATRRAILIYTVALIPVSLLPWMLHLTGPIYGVAAVAMNLYFLACAVRVWFDQGADGVSRLADRPAKSMFRFSLIYLAALFLALAVDHQWVAGF